VAVRVYLSAIKRFGILGSIKFTKYMFQNPRLLMRGITFIVKIKWRST
jgi:hypothetical protein